MIGDGHLHLHGRALSVSGGHHLPHRAAKGRIRIRVEGHPCLLSFTDTRDVRLVDIHFDFQCGEVRHGHHRAARQPTTDTWRDHLAHLSILAQHGAGKWRADDRVVVIGERQLEPCVRHAAARNGRVDPRLCLRNTADREIKLLLRYQTGALRPHVALTVGLAHQLIAIGRGLNDTRIVRGHVGFRLRDRRLEIRVVEPGNHHALPDERPFAHAEVRQSARGLGGHGRFGARDHVAICRDGCRTTCRRRTSAHRRTHRHHLHQGDGTHLHVPPAGCQQRDSNNQKEQIADQRAPDSGRWRIAIDTEFGEIGWSSHRTGNATPQTETVPTGTVERRLARRPIARPDADLSAAGLRRARPTCRSPGNR